MASPQITDRALRYRAQKNAPEGERVCCLCGAVSNVEVDHVDGHEENGEPENLMWACRSCNTAKGFAMKNAGMGRRTRQFNPAVKGATTLGEWMQAVGAITPHKGKKYAGKRYGLASEMPVHEAVAIIRATSPAKRSQFASQLRRHNPGVKAATRGVLKQYDRATGLIGTVTSLPRKFVGSLVGERSKRKRNPPNPESESRDMYEAVHGKPAESQVVVKEEFHRHEHLATLGVLVEFWVAPITMPGMGKKVETSDPNRDFDEVGADENTVFLAANEAGTQLYFVGGDQSLDLDKLKFTGDWVKDSMVIGVVYELTYRTRKKFDKFKLTEYYHELGEETGDQPMLVYDSLSPHCSISGGKYKIKMPLLGMSPGIEN